MPDFTTSTSVDNFMTSSGVRFPIRNISASTSLLPSDYTLKCNASGAAIIVTLPAASGVSGQMFNVKKIDATVNSVTISGASLIDDSLTKSTTSQYTNWQIHSDGITYSIV